MGHASYRGIRRCRHEVSGQEVNLGTISAVVRAAPERALALVAGQAPPGARAMARDEIYGRARQGTSLNVVDVDSGAVWAAEGPLPVDGETGTLTLWAAQERGLRWRQVVSGGCVDTDVIEHAMTVLETGRPQVIEYGYAPDMTWEVGLMCGGADP